MVFIMDDKLKIIGFCGRKRSGKGELANALKEKYEAEVLSVANYLKTLCSNILGFDLSAMERMKDDNSEFLLHPDNRWYSIINNETDIDIDTIRNEIEDVTFTNVRQMLQVIGTDLIRKYLPEWHINKLKEDIIKYRSIGKIVAIDDVRFPNERATIERLGGSCYFIIRPKNDLISNHISENSLKWQMFDDRHIIINEYSLEEYQENFIRYYESNMSVSEKPYLLWSDLKWKYEHLEHNFGTERTDLVDEILKQNIYKKEFVNHGIIILKIKSEEMERNLLKEVYNRTDTNSWLFLNFQSRVHYLINDPLIIENFKKYL